MLSPEEKKMLKSPTLKLMKLQMKLVILNQVILTNLSKKFTGCTIMGFRKGFSKTC